MQRISKNKKLLIGLLILLLITLVAGLILLAIVLLKPTNSNINTDEPQIVSYSISYPVSYNNPTFEVEEQIEIIPLNADILIKSINTEHYCGDNDTSNLGLVSYRYSTGDFATHNQNTKFLIIHNKNNVVGVNADKDFTEVINVIDNKTEISTIKDLHAFSYGCSGSVGTFIKTFEVDFPAADKSLAYIYVGGTQYAWANLSDIKFTLKILSQKGNNVMLMTEYFEGSELFTEGEVATCSTQSEYDYSYLPMECIRDLYNQTPGIQEKVNERTHDLIKFFEF